MINIVKCFLNDDMIFFLTTIFKNIFLRYRNNQGNMNQPLFIMANVLASVMIRNHKEIYQIVVKENNMLERFEDEMDLPKLDHDGKPIE